MGKIKGSVLIQIVMFLRSKKEASRRALPVSLHKYLETRILVNNWYPEEEYLSLLEATANLFEVSGDEDLWVQMGRVAAKAYVDRTYQMMIRKGDAVGTIHNFGLLWKLRHDTGHIEIANLSPGTTLIKLTDYVLISEKICRAIAGTIHGMLETANISGIEITKVLCRARGDDSCTWQVQWDDKNPDFES